MFKQILVCLLVIAIAATFAIPKAFGAELAEKQELLMASFGRDLRAVDPAFAVLGAEVIIPYMMFNALVRYPPGDAANLDAIEPDLAERWDVSKDGKTWTFYLRKGVQFHKGFGELTAEDVKFTFDRMKPEGAPWAKDYKRIDNIEILDKYTVRFHLKMSDPYMLMKLANFHGGFIVSKKAREKLGKMFKTEPVGTGPFELVEYRPKDKYMLKRHEGYWRGKPYLEKVTVLFMPDNNSRTLALKKGAIHCSYAITEEKWVDMMRKTTKVVVDTDFQIGVHGALHFNMTRKPFDDIRVRKALSYALNRKEFRAFFGPSVFKPLYAHAPQYTFGALKDKDVPENLRYTYNPEKAKQMLKEAGVPKGFTINAFCTELSSYLNAMTMVQEQWRRIGINLKINTVDHPTYHSYIRKDRNDVVWYYASRAPVAGEYLEQWYHSNSIVKKKTAITNFSHYGEVDADGDGDVVDNNIDEYVDKAWAEMDPDVRRQLYRKAQYQLLNDLPTIPLTVSTSVLARQPYLDLGYEPKGTMIYGYHITEKTRLLKH